MAAEHDAFCRTSAVSAGIRPLWVDSASSGPVTAVVRPLQILRSQRINEVTHALSKIDEMTQQNAALVEQSSAAALSLREQAGRLSALLGRFVV